MSDVYGRSNSELSPKKAVLEDASHISENQGMQMLGQIKHGSCRPRAILFKVLADTVGLENTLVVVSFTSSGILYPLLLSRFYHWGFL